jgi:hypothetical protein
LSSERLGGPSVGQICQYIGEICRDVGEIGTVVCFLGPLMGSFEAGLAAVGLGVGLAWYGVGIDAIRLADGFFGRQQYHSLVLVDEGREAGSLAEYVNLLANYAENLPGQGFLCLVLG